MKTRIVAKTVVFNSEGSVLLLRRSGTDTRRPHQWDLPGGEVDDGEDFVQAIVREAREEAGINVVTNPRSLVFSETLVADLNVVFLIFVSTTSDDSVALSSEHEEFTWLPLGEALSAIEYDRHKRALAHILDNNLQPNL